MAWLMRRGEVLASLEVANTVASRLRGFGAQQSRAGAMLIMPAHLPHSIGSKVDLDVAHLDSELCVIAMSRLKPARIGLWRPSARAIVEVEAGAFSRWTLCIGDQLEIKQ